MAKNKTPKALIASIIFASVIVSSSLTFFGMQVSGFGTSIDGSDKDFQQEVFVAVDAYIENEEAKYAAQAKADAPAEYISDISVDDDAVLGSKDAPVTIVEFSDYECPFCKRFVNNTLPLIQEKYIDTGKVQLVYRDFIVRGHDRATPAAIAAECVRDQKGDGSYYEMHDLIFSDDAGNLSDEILLSFAKDLGVDEAKFQECIIDEASMAEIAADQADGNKYGVTGTPAFFINGYRISGAQPYEVFEAAIEQALAQ